MTSILYLPHFLRTSHLQSISSWMTVNLLTLNPFKTEFLLIGLPQQLSKLSNPLLSLPSTHPILSYTSARNLEFIFYSSLAFVKQIPDLSSTCHYHNRDLRRIRHTLDFCTASTIATSLVHSHLDYCNYFFYSLPSSQLHRLQFKIRSHELYPVHSSHSHHSNIAVTSLVQDWTTYTIIIE